MSTRPRAGTAVAGGASSVHLASVVMPVLNAADTLPAHLDALSRQTYPGPWELIIADNGSSDASRSVCMSFTERIRSLRIIDASDKRGASYARNAGALAARGDVLAFCDADDVVAPEWLEGLVEAIESSDVVGGALDITALNDTGTQGWRVPQQPPGALAAPHGFLPMAPTGNLAVRRLAFDALGGFREDFVGGMEDVEFSWRAQLNSHRIAYAPKARVMYRYRTGPTESGRQSYRYGLMSAKLYREYRGSGMPASDLRTALGAWKWALLNVVDLCRGRAARGAWLSRVGFRAGRLVGSARFRVVYP